VLAEILMQSYGPPKKKAVHLDGTDLAYTTGLDRNNARRALRELLDAGIIRHGDCPHAYTFVKDFEAWTPRAGRLGDRLGGHLLGWIRSSTSRHGKRTHKPIPESNETQKSPCIESTQTRKLGVCESTQTQKLPTLESTQTQAILPPLEPPIAEARAS